MEKLIFSLRNISMSTHGAGGIYACGDQDLRNPSSTRGHYTTVPLDGTSAVGEVGIESGRGSRKPPAEGFS